MDLFLFHCLILIWISIGTARHMFSQVGDQLLAAGLFAWGNVVVASLIVAGLNHLGDAEWFMATSVAIALLTYLSLLRLDAPLPTPDDRAPEADEPTPNGWAKITFVGAFVLLALAVGGVIWVYEPNNPDALAWRLPRAMYYLGQHSLAPFDAVDLRQILLPFNYDLLLAFVLGYAAPLQCLNLFNLIAWLLTGLAVYRLCRQCSVNANASLATAWLVLAASPVIAQVTAVTVELPAACALLCVFIFGQRWWQQRRSADAAVAGLAAGLAAGSSFSNLLFMVAAGLAGLIWLESRLHSHDLVTQTNRRGGLRWVALAILLTLPFLLANMAVEGFWPWRLFQFSSHQFSAHLFSDFQALFFPFAPNEPLSWNEDNAGLGLMAVIFVGAAIIAMLRKSASRPVIWLTRLGLIWLLGGVLSVFWSGNSPRILLPALLLLSPGVGMLIEAGWVNAHSWRWPARTVIAICLLGSGVSGADYLWNNTSHPLRPLLSTGFTPPALPSLPLLVEHRMAHESRVNVDTDGINESIFPFMTLKPGQRFTSQRKLDSDSFNLLSRAALSRNAAYNNPGGLPIYTHLGFLGKRTSGVEYLAIYGAGASARDYYGILPHPDRLPPTDNSQSILVTLYPPPSGSPAESTLIKLDGLHPGDDARVELSLEKLDGGIVTLATFTDEGEKFVQIPTPFHRLVYRVYAGESDREIADAVVAFEPSDNDALRPVDPDRPSSASSLFVTDLVVSRNNAPIVVDGLLPLEGPFPQWNLPFLRWARTPLVKIGIPPIPDLQHLQLSFSVRLHVRKKAGLDVVFNDQLVQRFRIDDPTTWLDVTLDLTPQVGENTLEFRDGPMNSIPEWLDYLERYPDVKASLESNHTPLEQGARDHYEMFGRREGRTVRMKEGPEPAPDGYYFMFRNIRLEGFKKP